MATMNDRILDAALDVIRTETNALHVCSQVPTTYAEATSTYSRGSKSSPTIGSVGDASPDGTSGYWIADLAAGNEGVTYTTEEGDLDIVGTWGMQVYADFGSTGKWYSTTTSLTVNSVLQKV